MKIINVSVSIAVLGCLFFAGCKKEEGNLPGGKQLTVGVVMAESPDAKSVTKAAQISGDTIPLEGDYVFVAQSTPRSYEQPADDEIITRGTPMSGAGNITAIGINVFNSGTGSFSSSTPLEQTLSAKSSGGSWSVAPAFVLKDDTQYTYAAFTPEASSSNGISVTSDGRTVNYTAPATVADQPDLCTASLIKDDKVGHASFAMSHRLAAVGIKAMGNWVKINSVTISNVYSSGTLDMETGTWSNLGTKSTFSPGLAGTNLSTNGSMNDITAANGYLMLPPQTFTDDNQTISVNYTYLYAGASPDPVVSTFKLKDLTGGKWVAGQIVTYNIQLQSYFSLSFNPASLTLGTAAGSKSFTYSTNSPSASDPKFSSAASWIKNVSVNRSTKTVTFNYDANPGTTNRTSSIFVTSGFTEANYSITQIGVPTLTLSSYSTTCKYGEGGSAFHVIVTTSGGFRWRVVDPGKDGKWSKVSFSKTEGASGETVTITTKGNPQHQARTIPIKFEIIKSDNNVPDVSKTYTITQEEIQLHDVSNSHTQFVRAGLTYIGMRDGWNNGGYTRRAWAENTYNILRDNSLNIPNTNGVWSHYNDGWDNTQKGLGYTQGINHCRSKYGSKAFVPAQKQIILWGPNNPISFPHVQGKTVVIATSTVYHRPGNYWNHDVIYYPYPNNPYIVTQPVRQHEYLYHVCYIREDTW